MTRRPAKEGEYALALVEVAGQRPRWVENPIKFMGSSEVLDIHAVFNEGLLTGDRLKWEVGRSYAIQPPPRGQRQVGRFTLESIAWELGVKQMPDEDVIREGFRSLGDFLAAWARFYGDSFFGPPLGVWGLGMTDVDIDERLLPPAVWQILEEAA